MQKFNLKEWKSLGIAVLLSMAVLAVMLQIIFYRESPLVIIKVVIAIAYLAIIPGALILHWLIPKISVVEKIIVGSLLSAALVGMFSYYLGIVGILMPVQLWILSPIMIIVAVSGKILFPTS